ncbi:MAG: NADH-quinone oxidoreductase [Candidatus Melainabacteria bacterium RIFOXYA12_FULL_32_12]|nr:MAG: NADH-quinone oxidoreductase [Candidatus Melainabacteria bacterium RIFOXYA12_FULL_32_12]
MKIIITAIDFVYNWGRSNSIWPLTFATSCCGIEMISTSAAKFDIARFGSEVFRATPRQADLMITAGTVTHRMAPALVKLYEQMPEPKYVLAMGACAVTGGMYENDSYSVVRGVDRLVPVDVYLPGCPPRPEALLDAIIQLQKKMRTETILERKKYIESHKIKVKLPEDDSEILLPHDELEVYHWGVQKDGYNLNELELTRSGIGR